jgi:TonB-dependent receptor
LSGFPVTGTIKDTSATHAETNWLPNVQLTLRPTEFMNIRLAAYRALARPDFNLRLEKYIVQGGGGVVSLLLGNPALKTSTAWNFEASTAFFSNTVGLISVSAFYKEIDDMVHVLQNASVMGDELVKNLGIGWEVPFPSGTAYSLTVPYNSPTPTKVYGFEFEHQINFSFLPGFLKNVVLSYNGSVVRSQTYLISTTIETTYVSPVPGFPPVPIFTNVVGQSRQKLEGQPEFYGNISLGYDIGGFSIRASLFHQGEFNSAFSASSISDQLVNAYTRWDLALKQDITDHISVRVNVSNLTDAADVTSIYNRIQEWKLLNTSEHYGMTVDLGLRVVL